MKPRRRIVLAAAIILSSVACAAAVWPHSAERRLGDTVLYVPSWARVEGAPGWLRSIPGLDTDSDQMLVTLPGTEVARRIPGYVVRDGKVDEDLLLLVSRLNDRELQSYSLHPQIKDMFASVGQFDGRAAEWHPEFGAWEVRGRFDGPDMFQMSRIDPAMAQNAQALQAAWMGSCMGMHMTETETGDTWSCHAYALSGHLMVEFDYGPKNVARYDAIRRFVVNEVNSWKSIPG